MAKGWQIIKDVCPPHLTLYKKVSNNGGLEKPKLYPHVRQVAKINQPRQMPILKNGDRICG
jgi:hypothetical protein